MSIKKKRNLIWVAVMGGLLAWTIYNVLRDQTPGQLAHALVSADWRFLLIGVALMAAFVAFEARSSHLILRRWARPSPTAGVTSIPAPDFSSAILPLPPPAASRPRSIT